MFLFRLLGSVSVNQSVSVGEVSLVQVNQFSESVNRYVSDTALLLSMLLPFTLLPKKKYLPPL